MKGTLMLKLFTIITFVILWSIFPSSTLARITPEDIVNQRLQNFETRSQGYSQINQQKLEDLSQKIAKLNKQKTDHLTALMDHQAAILDEYQRRKGESKAVEEARYWITYAHEAVAYQAAKIYIFDLTSEANIRSDTRNTILFFQSELNSTRDKVIKSQRILESTLK